MSELDKVEAAVEVIVPQTYWYLTIGNIIGTTVILLIFVWIYYRITRRIDVMQEETIEIQTQMTTTQKKLADAMQIFTERSGELLSITANNPEDKMLGDAGATSSKPAAVSGPKQK